MVAIGVSRHLDRARADRRRERVRGELEPVFSRFFETEDRARLAQELRPRSCAWMRPNVRWLRCWSDREVAIRAAEALVALSRRPRARDEARARLESSAAWAVEYARKVAEVVEAGEVAEVSA